MVKKDMKEEDKLISKYGKDSGMRVPEGYFADLEKNILQSLPPYPQKPAVTDLSRWHRVKPYVYLAAMFCGIWLMMKVFHTATQPLNMSLENPPAALVEMLDNGMDFDNHYLPYSSEWNSEDEDFILSYDNIDDFKHDFYSTL